MSSLESAEKQTQEDNFTSFFPFFFFDFRASFFLSPFLHKATYIEKEIEFINYTIVRSPVLSFLKV